jgi:hypothetical protein
MYLCTYIQGSENGINLRCIVASLGMSESLLSSVRIPSPRSANKSWYNSVIIEKLLRILLNACQYGKSFCWAKLNQRTHLSTPPPPNLETRAIRARTCPHNLRPTPRTTQFHKFVLQFQNPTIHFNLSSTTRQMPALVFLKVARAGEQTRDLLIPFFSHYIALPLSHSGPPLSMVRVLNTFCCVIFRVCVKVGI